VIRMGKLILGARLVRSAEILVTRTANYQIVERSIRRYPAGNMSNAHYSDAAVSKLRTIVDAIDREIVQAPPTATLRAAWVELLAVLALGPAPQTRECPSCHGVGMRAASRCGHCWAALAPLPPISDGTPLQGDA
jgi:hypothetical protein